MTSKNIYSSSHTVTDSQSQKTECNRHYSIRIFWYKKCKNPLEEANAEHKIAAECTKWHVHGTGGQCINAACYQSQFIVNTHADIECRNLVLDFYKMTTTATVTVQW